MPLDQNAEGDLSYIPMPQEDENNNDGDIATWIASLEIGQFRQSPEREEGRQQWFALQDQQVHENLAQAIKDGRQDLTSDAILKSQPMKTPADLSEDEMRSGQCEICQENLWPSDTVAASAPDMIVRIVGDKGCIYHRICIIQALVDNPQCLKCSSWVLCEIHDGKAVLTWSPNSQPPKSQSGMALPGMKWEFSDSVGDLL